MSYLNSPAIIVPLQQCGLVSYQCALHAWYGPGGWYEYSSAFDHCREGTHLSRQTARPDLACDCDRTALFGGVCPQMVALCPRLWRPRAALAAPGARRDRRRG